MKLGSFKCYCVPLNTLGLWLHVLLNPVLILLVLVLEGAHLSAVVVILFLDVQTLPGTVTNLAAVERPLVARVARRHLHLQVLTSLDIGERHIVESRSDVSVLVRVPQLIISSGSVLVIHHDLDTRVLLATGYVQNSAVHLADDIEVSSRTS